MSTLRSHLNELAQTFADAVLDAIKGSSIEELLAESSGAPRRHAPAPARAARAARAVRAGGGARAGRPAAPAAAPVAASPAAAQSGAARAPKARGRLARRTPEQIAKTLGSVVTLLKGKKAGLRSEEIQKALRLDKREVPRVLKEGLSKKALKSKGVKRATTYFAA